jgi:ABC-type antimicrobial peptide transport system permease subunit
VDEELADRRVQAQLFGAFAISALLLSCIGIYGLIAHSVAARTRELGIRQALGATRANVLVSVLRDGLRLALFGVALGLPLAFIGARWLAALLYEVRPYDPLTFALVPVLMLMAAIVACTIPGRRAAAISPMRAIREP